MSLLEVKHLCIKFHTAAGTATAVRDLSFCLEEGEILGIVGESGSGKSVTSYAIMGLLDERKAEIAEGEIWFQGENLLTISEKSLCRLRGKDMSLIFQEPTMALNPVRKVRNQLREVYKLHMPEKLRQADAEILALLQKLNIADAELVMNKYPFELSGGMKQRILIAMAMISKPRLLIADEPTTALDVTTQSEILDLLKLMQKETNCAMILITHDLGVIAEMTDRVVVMYRGQLQEQCDAASFFADARHPYSQDLLQARPEFFDTRFQSIPGTIPNAYQSFTGCAYCGRCREETELCHKAPVELRQLEGGHCVRCVKWDTNVN